MEGGPFNFSPLVQKKKVEIGKENINVDTRFYKVIYHQIGQFVCGHQSGKCAYICNSSVSSWNYDWVKLFR